LDGCLEFVSLDLTEGLFEKTSLDFDDFLKFYSGLSDLFVLD